MKSKKNFVALLLVFALCATCLPTMAFASEMTTEAKTTEGLQLPADAVILYEDENAVLYQSNEPSVEPREVSGENNYGYAWVKDNTLTGSFPVKNTYSGKTGVTWKVEASDPNDCAQIYMETASGLTVLTTRLVYAKNGDVRLTLKNAEVGTYTVHFIAVKNTEGMRIMCWTYQ